MITAQLGPPPAVPGRASTAEGSAGDDAPGMSAATEDGAFVALLLGIGPSADGTDETAPPSPAAGPLTGELPTVTDADAAGLAPQPAQGTPTAADAAVAAPQGAAAAAITTAAAVAAPPADADGAAPIATAGRPDQSLVPASPAAPSTGPGPTGAPRQGEAPAVHGATAPAAPPAQPSATSAAAATVTITLSRQETPATARAEGSPASAVLAAPPPPVASPPPAAPAAPTPSVAPATGAETPAAAVPAPTHPTAAAPAPVVGHAGVPQGVTSAAELAHELGARMRMAVREGGRELVVNLRPPELGHLTVRVTMIDGALTAHITADRPDAARLLQQSLPQLGTVLGDLGYNLDGLDVTYGGQDRRDAPGSSPDGHTGDPGTPGVSDDGSAANPVPSTAAAVTDGERLDLLV